MHEEKIWALDFAEQHTPDSENPENGDRPNLMMLTGGSDSKIKIWTDSTAAEELRLKEEKLGLIQDE
jgi:hypothetical protein